MMKCPSCSSNVPSGRFSCPDCGVDVQDSFAPTQLLDILPDSPSAKQSAPTYKTPTRAAVRSSSPDSIDDARFIPGTVLGSRYRIVGLLGRGGMGEVYRADDLKLIHPVALKLLPDELAGDGAALSRFHREVRTARQVSHPNVCRVYDIAEVDGQHMLSMEFIKGEDLASLLTRIGRLPADKSVEIARQLCAGLAAAHERGVLHRDLKPANVMIDERGKARITDFGLAGLVEEFAADEIRTGTPAYMSPEQLAGDELTVRSDIYSLGLVLYELFTGHRAFDAPTLPDLIRLRRDSTPPNPSMHVKDLDPLVERVILRCLETDVRRRPATALQVAAALPGGDPLAAALAAGETPSPEVVAAARMEGSLRPSVALACLVLLWLGFAAIVLLSGKVWMHRQVPLEKSPEVLADRAGSIVKRHGYTVPPVDSAYGFGLDGAYLHHVDEHDQSPTRWEKLASGQPPVVNFWYRQSPRYLESRAFTNLRVSLFDPPPLDSGMASVVLDTRGRLLQLNAVPPQVDDEQQPMQSPPPAPDWHALFADAGFDLARFTPARSRWIPPVYSDTRVAWEGVFPDQPDVPIRVEAASYRGKPVYFEVVQPWSKPTRMDKPEHNPATRMGYIVLFVLCVLLLAASVLLAMRNMHRGLGDQRGALRLALFAFALNMLGWLIGAHHVPTMMGEVVSFGRSVGVAMINAAALWILYMALEPYVRRRWPERIISWSRLLGGDFRDPLIGRDILIGGLFGVSIILISITGILVRQQLGAPTEAPIWIWPDTLHGARGVAYVFVSVQPFVSVLDGLGYLFLLLVLVMIFRKEWLATGVLWLLFVASFLFAARFDLVGFVVAGIIMAMFIFVLLRFGLLALMFGQFFLLLCELYPYTTDFSVWYAGASLFAISAVVAITLYGFYTSLAGQKLLGGSFLHD